MPVPIDADHMRAWRLFLAAHAAVTRRLESELQDERDLPLSWYDVLVQLHEAGGRRRMHELADSLLISRSATTRFVERLERAGLVSRCPAPSDRRGTLVELTPHGKATLRAAAPIHLRGIAHHFADVLTREEAGVLGRMLEKLVRAAGGEPAVYS